MINQEELQNHCQELAEQLGLQQRFGDRGAIEVDERGACTRSGPVHEARQKSLAGPRLALDQNRREAPGILMALQKDASLLPEGDDLGIVPDQVVEGVHGGGVALRCRSKRAVNSPVNDHLR